MKLKMFVWLLLVAWAGWGCAASSEDSLRAAGTSNDDDYEGDMYTDADADADTDADADSDADYGDPFVPETEERFDYRIPVSSGKYVFIADTLNDKVIAVDSVTLEIFTTEVGAKPTHVVPINDNGHVAVISLNSDEVTIIRMRDDGTAQVNELDVRPDTNALSISHNGKYIIAFWDDLFTEDSGVPSTDQEITVIDTTLGAEKVYDLSVGIHPMQVMFNNDDSRAFIVTESGINIIELAELNDTYFPTNISLFDFTTIAPEQTETVIDPTGTYAIGRREDSAMAYVAMLDGSQDDVITFGLNTIPTDVDVAADGSFGLFTLRATHEVAVFSLPFTDDQFPFSYVGLGTQPCGTATISEDGAYTALFTGVEDGTANRQILTVLSKAGNTFDVDTTLLNRDIKGVQISPDSGSLIIIHEIMYGSTEQPYSYSLVKLPGMQSKFQQLSTDPIQMLTTEDGAFAYMLLSSQEIEIINLETFIVDKMSLGSVPQAAGYASLTDKIFISQEHPSGRMTFMDVDGDNVKTITGYTLNDQSTN